MTRKQWNRHRIFSAVLLSLSLVFGASYLPGIVIISEQIDSWTFVICFYTAAMYSLRIAPSADEIRELRDREAKGKD